MYCDPRRDGPTDKQAVTLEVTAKVWPVFTVAKLLGGIGIGAVQATLPVVSQLRELCRLFRSLTHFSTLLSTHPIRSEVSSSSHTLCEQNFRPQSSDLAKLSNLTSWFSLGGLMASITLQVRNVAEPMNWQTPLYIQYGMIGVSFLIFVLLPESPCTWSTLPYQHQSLTF